MAEQGNDSGVTEHTMEEIEAALAAPAGPAKIEGDDIPEQFRGKTAKEIADIAAASERALRVSEQARLSAAETRQATPAPAPAPAPVAAAPLMTREEFQAMYEQDPLGALELYDQQREAKLLANLEARVLPLAAGAASAAEAQARSKFESEFELFGSEIKQLASQVPNKAFLASPEGWEQLISFVRGKEGNFDKLMEHKIAKNQGAQARADQAAAAGFTSRSAVATIVKGASDPTNHGLDATELKVAAEFNMSPAEYVKWRDMK